MPEPHKPYLPAPAIYSSHAQKAMSCCGLVRCPSLPHEELSDDQVAEVLRQLIARGGRLSREADVFLAGICADHLTARCGSNCGSSGTVAVA
jgi:hypothetical protein